MKKSIVLLVISAFLLSSCGSKEKAFDTNLQESYSEMTITLASSCIVCDKVSQTWSNAIRNNIDHHGRYCYDFNDALKTLFTEYQADGTIDKIELHKDKMINSAKLLNNPPKSRKDCYDDYMEIVSEASSLARMATDPTGSLQSYNNQTNETFENLTKKIELFKIKYGDFLKTK